MASTTTAGVAMGAESPALDKVKLSGVECFPVEAWTQSAPQAGQEEQGEKTGSARSSARGEQFSERDVINTES